MQTEAVALLDSGYFCCCRTATGYPAHRCDCILQAWQQQPPPFLQQQRPLRRLPTTPAEVAQAVQQKVIDTCVLSQHGKGDMQDIQNLMNAALLAVSPSQPHCLE